MINGQVIHQTDTFRAYTGFADSADAYRRFLNQNARYKSSLVYRNDPEKVIHEMASAGYATDPDYAKSLTRIIRSHNLAQYDK